MWIAHAVSIRQLRKLSNRPLFARVSQHVYVTYARMYDQQAIFFSVRPRWGTVRYGCKGIESMIKFFELQRFPRSFLIRIKGQPEKIVVFSTGTNSLHSDR